jgi:hypothetical protein
MTALSADVRLLLDRYFECVLIRHGEGVYDLHTARLELAEAFGKIAEGEAALRTHIQAVVEAGDEA